MFVTDLQKQTARSLSRAAAKRVREQLAVAKAAVGRDDPPAFFGGIAGAVEEQLSQRLDRRVEGMTRDELRATMNARGFAEPLVERTCEELDNCDFGRFARSASSGGQLSTTLERVEQLVVDIARASIRAKKDAK